MARLRLGPFACLAVLASTISPSNAQNATNILGFVDPLIGTVNGGHVFAGASLPFSMAKAFADTNGDELPGGYASDNSNITGFSHLHDSGTGGVSFVSSFSDCSVEVCWLRSNFDHGDGILEKWFFLFLSFY